MIKPLRDDVYVEILDVPVSSVIVRPHFRDNDADHIPVRGKVLAVGPGRVTRKAKLPCAVRVGEVIQFYFGGISMYVRDRKHAIVEGKAIQAVIS